MITRHRAWVAVAMTAVLVAGLLLPACQGKTWEILLEQEVSAVEGATITSADGKVTLEIPPGALEKDTRITVGIVPEEEWKEETRYFEPLGPVLALEPDGLEFNKPVGVTLRFDVDDLVSRSSNDGYLPLLLLSRDSDDEWDILRNVITRISLETGEVTVSGETSHFSEVTCTMYPSLTISLSPDGQFADVGEQFNSTVKVANTGNAPLTVTLEYHTEGDDVVVVGQSSVSLTIDKDSSEFADPQPCWKCVSRGGGNHRVTMKLPYQIDIADAFGLAWHKEQATLPPEFNALADWKGSDFLACEVDACTSCSEVTPPPEVAVDTGTSGSTTTEPTEDPDPTTTEDPDPTTTEDPEPTTTEPETTVIESSSVFQELDAGVYTVMIDLPDDMEGQVYDFEIFPAEMTPPWAGATIPGVLRTGVYRSNIEEDGVNVGVKVFSNQPFPVTPFTVNIQGDPGAEKIAIYLTDKDHETIGVLHISEGDIPTDVLTPPQTDDPSEPANPCPYCGKDPCEC